jgi:hypothetical protein
LDSVERIVMRKVRAPGRSLAQRGPDEAPERLRAKARRGKKSQVDPHPGCLASEGNETKPFKKILNAGIQQGMNKPI